MKNVTKKFELNKVVVLGCLFFGVLIMASTFMGVITKKDFLFEVWTLAFILCFSFSFKDGFFSGFLFKIAQIILFLLLIGVVFLNVLTLFGF